jgi:hypothetical protein
MQSLKNTAVIEVEDGAAQTATSKWKTVQNLAT